jgi:hypothetical protein
MAPRMLTLAASGAASVSAGFALKILSLYHNAWLAVLLSTLHIFAQLATLPKVSIAWRRCQPLLERPELLTSRAQGFFLHHGYAVCGCLPAASLQELSAFQRKRDGFYRDKSGAGTCVWQRDDVFALPRTRPERGARLLESRRARAPKPRIHSSGVKLV